MRYIHGDSMSETPTTPPAPPAEPPKTQLESDVDMLEKMEDSNPKTWINEDTWKTFFMMLLFYSISGIFKAGSVDINTGVVNWSWAAFWLCIDGTMLPLFGAAIRNQVMGGANKKLADQNRAFAVQKSTLVVERDTAKEEIATLSESLDLAKEELYKVRADLNAKCETLQVLKEATGLVKK